MRKIFLSIVTIFIAIQLSAQKTSTADSLKVGLVLSGGGAKGLAHIGALKVIEEAGLKIDYIGGTSMGAIVGALYASGYSATELDSIFRSTDFSTLIQDNVPRGAKNFYEKEDGDRYALSLPFNNFKVSFPSAISSGQNIYNLLVKLLYHVKDTRDFSKLPIPFFCVATDVETGAEVLMNKGYLAESIMASGTFPSLFEPAELDGKILIDGGVVNNYPVEKLRAMGANVVVGVDVQHGLANREDLSSATEILLQINNYRSVDVMLEKEALTDIYIKPDIEAFSVIDFDLGNMILREGEKAAMSKYEKLKELSIRQNALQRPNKKIESTDTITINRLIIEGHNNYTRSYIKGKLRLDLNEKITFEKLQYGLNNLAATKNFNTIRYELFSNKNGLNLLLKLKENKDKMYIKMGAHYDDLYKSAAIINLTKKNFLAQDDVASFDIMLGDNVRYRMEYYIDKGFHWSFGINSAYNVFNTEVNYDVISSNFPVPNDDNINSINLGVVDLTNQFYLQTVWQEEFAINLGLEHRFFKYSTRTLGEQANANISTNNTRTIFEKSNYLSAFGKLKLDTYNDKYFPTRGLFFNGDIHFYFSSSDYNDNFKEFSIVKGNMGMALPLFKNLSLKLETGGGFKLGESDVRSLDFIMGGYGNDFGANFIPFLGYDFLSLPGNSYIKAYGRLDYEFAFKNHLLFSANFANVADDIFRTADWFSLPEHSGFGVGYGFESFIGPVEVQYSWSPERSDGNFFFSIGYWF